MSRLFERHKIRQTQNLDGMWDFYPEKEGEKRYTMPVPGCWEQHPDLLTFRGKGTYKKTYYQKETSDIRLEFKGVSHTADVYFNDKHVANHYNAFTPFSTIIKDVPKGMHEIKVLVDNTFGEHSALHLPNDYYTYGGITRPVVLEKINEVYIKNIRFTPYFEANEWKANIEINIHNTSKQKASAFVDTSIDGDSIRTEKIHMDAESELWVELNKTFKGVSPWSHKEPTLYLLSTILYVNGEPVDDLIERVGFRTVHIAESKILLNNEEVFLKGFNRHEDYGEIGCALPLQLMVKDMDLMQDMGVNALRTSHYPNDERFLDLCDERGILVWEENHARGLSLENMQNPNFDLQCENCIHEMIENHYNHPSIIIWGILNECASETEEGRSKYKAQFEQIKRLDQSRPTTFATCRHFTDICLDLPDIVSFNIYSGWYKDESVKEASDKEIAWIKDSGGDDKPIIVSEFGGGAIYGYRSRTRCKWSEERQADIIDECLSTYGKDKRISGLFIWQFADCRVTEEEWFANRPRSYNNKGVVDEYRRPKMAYDIVKKHFEKL